MHYHNGYLTEEYGERTLICRGCKKLIGFTGGEMRSYGIRIVCSCGELVQKDKCEGNADMKSVKSAYQSGNDYICPNCGRLLFRIDRRHIRNLSFIAVCKCGKTFCRAKDVSARERVLSNRAILVQDRN